MSAGELIPTARLQVMEFARVTNQTARMGNSGNSIRNQLGPSKWGLRVETARLNLAEARIWSAWLARRAEGVTFTAWRLWRANPAGAIGEPDGAIAIAVDAGASEITLSGVGAYAASAGDMISWRTLANGYCCVEATAGAAATAGAITIPVWPRPMAPHASAPDVRRVKALAEFELTTDPGGFEDYDGRTLSFEAIQILR